MTIYDIAELAGVSASTVSRVINNKPGIREATREKVKALLKEHNMPGKCSKLSASWSSAGWTVS